MRSLHDSLLNVLTSKKSASEILINTNHLGVLGSTLARIAAFHFVLPVLCVATSGGPTACFTVADNGGNRDSLGNCEIAAVDFDPAICRVGMGIAILPFKTFKNFTAFRFKY